MMKLTPEEYPAYRQWFELSLRIVWKIPDDLMRTSSPMFSVAEAEARSSAYATKVLSAGIADLLGMSADLSREEVQAMDAQFAVEGAITLTAVRERFSELVDRPLKFGFIASEEEYYALKPMIDTEISKMKKAKIEKLLRDYEASLGGGS